MQTTKTASPRVGFKAPPHNPKIATPAKAIPKVAPEGSPNGHLPGKGVKGFTGNGVLKGKV
jgi:hypothetical protein